MNLVTQKFVDMSNGGGRQVSLPPSQECWVRMVMQNAGNVVMALDARQNQVFLYNTRAHGQCGCWWYRSATELKLKEAKSNARGLRNDMG